MFHEGGIQKLQEIIFQDLCTQRYTYGSFPEPAHSINEKVCFMSQNLTPATAGISASLQLLDKSRPP